jgi:hypothetical protein
MQVEAAGKDQVRNLKFHIKIKDADLLGEAINEIVSQRTSGKIDPSGRGFRSPDPNNFVATIYSSTMILADQPSIPRDEKSEFIYTMDDVVFRTEIQLEGKDNKFNEREMDVTLSGGWIQYNGEYVLVIYTKKDMSKSTDFQKMQGRALYNAVFTRYVTHVVSEDVLELRGFDIRKTTNDYPDIKDDFNPRAQSVIDSLRGTAPTGGRRSLNAPAPSAPGEAPDYVKKNYYLYTKKNADIDFGYKDPSAPNRPFDPKTDPNIDFQFNFPNFVGEELAGDPQKGTQHNAPSSAPNPGDVSISFNNIQKNMPGEIFTEIYEYFKDGLEAKELNAGTNLTHGNAIYKANPEHGEESLRKRNLERISQLLKEIRELYKENKEYMVDFDDHIPEHRKAVGVNKNNLQYLNELEAYIKELKRHLPMSLAELDELIANKGEYAVNPKNISLLKILKTRQ